jgi:geranylgeranyl pyrophosphate synthase
MIHLLRTVELSHRAGIHVLLESPNDSRRELVDLLRRHGSLNYAHDQAQSYVAKAVESLAPLPAGHARDALVETARFMAHRAV